MEKTTEYGMARSITTSSGTLNDLIREFEQATLERKTDEERFARALEALSIALTYSVLKKLCNVGGEVKEERDLNGNVVGVAVMPSDTTRAVRDLRRGLASTVNKLGNVARLADIAEENELDKNGNWHYVTRDKDAKKALEKLLQTAIDDGYDLKQTACEYLLKCISERDIVGAFMTEPYTVRRLKKCVYIKREDSANGWETVETTALKEVLKAIRRDISACRSIQTASNKYTYIDFDVFDDDNASETAYIRVNGKYSVSVTNTAVSIDGKHILTTGTASIEEYENERALVTRLNLTAREKAVLCLRLQGYGYKAIGTYLGIRPDNVKVLVKRIRAKAEIIKK